MLDIIEEYASVCKPNPLHNQKEAKAFIPGQKINVNGYGYVDLKLPSGTLWAACNVGAKKPSESGLYFQWGDTIGYSKDQVGKDKQFTWDDYKWNSSGKGETFTKYTTESATLELEDDAAHVHMGGDWHMPTDKQIKELISETTSTFVRHLIGTNGRLFTSKKDPSKSIFIPDASCAYGGFVSNSQCFGDGDGNIWSSMLSANDVNVGLRLFFSASYVGLGKNSRYEGLPVRGVIG